MGMLDPTDDPRTMGLLSLGLGLLGSKGSFGNALSQAGPQALQSMRQVKDDQRRRAEQEQAAQMRAMQMQAAQMQMAQQQAAQQRQQAVEGAYRGALRSPEQMAMANGQGPTVSNAAAIPGTMPQIDQSALIRNLMQADPMAAYQMLQPKPEDMKVVGDSLVGVAGGKARELYRAPQKPDALPSAVREYEYARQQGYGGSFHDFVIQQKRAGASNVSVSMDKGFGDAFAKDAAGSLASSRDQAKAAASTIQTIDRINQTLDTGKVAIGPTSKFETFGRQLGETIGVGGKGNAEVLANTRKVIQGAAALAVDGAAALRGQGQITEGERALVSRAAGGDVDSLTAPEIRSLTGVLRKINGQRITSHQQQLGNVGKQFQPFVPFYQVDMPTEPASVDALLKKYGG